GRRPHIERRSVGQSITTASRGGYPSHWRRQVHQSINSPHQRPPPPNRGKPSHVAIVDGFADNRQPATMAAAAVLAGPRLGRLAPDPPETDNGAPESARSSSVRDDAPSPPRWQSRGREASPP